MSREQEAADRRPSGCHRPWMSLGRRLVLHAGHQPEQSIGQVDRIARMGRTSTGLPVANGPKTTLRRNPINEQGFGQSLVASFWSSKSDLGLDFLDFEMTLRHWWCPRRIERSP